MKKTSRDYVKAIARKHGISQQKARKLIVFAMKNFGRKIMHGQDITVQHFGAIWFHKLNYVRYLKVIRENEKKKIKKKKLRKEVRRIHNEKD